MKPSKKRLRTKLAEGVTEHVEVRYGVTAIYKDVFWGTITAYGLVNVTVYTNEPLMEIQAFIERTQTWSSQHHASKGTPPRDKLVGSEVVVACLLGVDPDNQESFLSMAQFCYDEDLEALTEQSLWSDIQDICYLYCVNEARPEAVDAYGRDVKLSPKLGFKSIEQELPTWGYHPVQALIETQEIVKASQFTYTKKTKLWTKQA